MLEHTIIRAILASREAYEAFQKFGDSESLSPISGAIFRLTDKHYRNDGSARQVDRDLLFERITAAYPVEKHASAARQFVEECLRDGDVSVPNFVDVIAQHARGKIGDKLSLALANRSEQPVIDKLISEYQAQSPLGIDASDERTTEIIDVFDTADLTEEKQKLEYIRLYPKSLNDHLDGGCLPGHHVVVFARPETGKTAFCVNLVNGFIEQRKSVLYVANEEPGADIRDRIRARLIGCTRRDIRDGAAEVVERLGERNLRGRISICETSLFESIRRSLDAAPKRVVVIDQIRNMRLKADGRTAELEAAGIEARAIAKDYGVLVVSVTQAGDSGTGKIYLDMSDIDSSKTGIPASADLLIGIGADASMKANGLLGISLSKNKLSGDHAQFTVSVNFATGEIQ